jgi:hypothetical protein
MLPLHLFTHCKSDPRQPAGVRTRRDNDHCRALHVSFAFQTVRDSAESFFPQLPAAEPVHIQPTATVTDMLGTANLSDLNQGSGRQHPALRRYRGYAGRAARPPRYDADPARSAGALFRQQFTASEFRSVAELARKSGTSASVISRMFRDVATARPYLEPVTDLLGLRWAPMLVVLSSSEFLLAGRADDGALLVGTGLTDAITALETLSTEHAEIARALRLLTDGSAPLPAQQSYGFSFTYERDLRWTQPIRRLLDLEQPSRRP